jgi:type III secretory pathway component EscT
MIYAKQILVGAAVGMVISIVLVNWVIGCGEMIQQPDGSWIAGECFNPFEAERNQ